MAQYPVVGADQQGIVEVLNYVASGPAGIGQQLSGFNNIDITNITGNQVLPYTTPVSQLYVAPIDLSDSTWLDDYTRQYTFSSVQPAAPFALGNGIIVDSVSPAEFNTPIVDGIYVNTAIVVECTDTYVIVRDTTAIPNPGVTGAGGRVRYFVTQYGYIGTRLNTDVNADVVVDASNSLVSVTAQLTITGSDYAVLYVDPMIVGTVVYTVQLNRYKAVNVGTAANPNLLYSFDTTISEQQIYSQNVPAPTQGIPLTYTIVAGSPAAGSAGVYNLPDGPSLTNGSGQGAGFSVNIISDIVDYATGTTVTASGAGGNYSVGDLVIIEGTQLGGLTPDNDLEMTVASIGGTGDVSIGPFETVFTTIYDQPGSGLYRYIVQLNVTTGSATAAVKFVTLGRRSLTARVVKK